MKLLTQPGDGAGALIKGINRAKKSIEIAIFRFDQREIEKALAKAVSRGVAVHALIAHTNRAGEANLRKLELRLLAAGVTVARTADDLVRYHGKFMIVDRHELYVLAFNLTYLDIERSRSFGVITRSPNLVGEAGRLFEADSSRNPYEPGSAKLVVSPANARQHLAAFIQGARKQLLIYDLKISDPTMIRALEERAKAGVEIRVIGKISSKNGGLQSHRLRPMRLHTRAMIRDGQMGFLGSQSLRGIELDMRREVGVIFRDTRIVSRMKKVFEDDWKAVEQQDAEGVKEPVAAERVANRVAKAIAKGLPEVGPVLDDVVKQIADDGELEIDAKAVEESVKLAVKAAVKEAVMDAVEEAAEQTPHGGE